MQLRDYAGMFRRHLLTLLLCVLAGLAGGIFHGTHGADTYEATSRSLLSIPASQTVQEQVAAAQLSGQLLSTYVQVATSRELAERVVARSPEFGSVDHVRKSLSASAEKATYLIDITASAGTKQGSAALANAAASALSDVIESLQTGRAEPVTALLLDKAVAPTNPSSPRPVRDISIGLALGLLVGVLLVLLQEALDSSIKSVAQAERATKSTVLASVARRRRGLPLAAATSATEQGEAFRSLRTAVQYLNDGRMPQTMLVTSSGEGDGKTTVAGNLTASLASAGHRVVLVDADLRRAGLTRQLQMQGGLGLSGVLDGTAQLDQAIRPWIDNADVLPAGGSPANPSELLGSESMGALLDDLAARYELVIFDAPPALAVTDAVVVAAQVAATLVVVRYGKTSRSSAQQAARLVTSVGGSVAGLVLNATPRRQLDEYVLDARTDAISG